ncbi:Tetratricopeptide repeat and ankyrin repeat containing 1 [Seminavis robusta]|uniref:Tetratricopeptide repeat and ankyrin repeat containing 1 n=1 Tax=Seminavis robusta TaxID=568900 RepID=A0A9N8EPG2_9STRA|nr:Tetratricopeptide repeat and ankyrin repeat containing 1 [Seminavis robusta]|eukprot:Sro1289_g259650.1 Tetratricopeptide repeat and ankyrin repeat containing 1 (573) ;mRNA; f:4590-6858
MKSFRIEPSTLWQAIRTIKSNALCLRKLNSLSFEEYMQLPAAYGLEKEQRELVYGLYEVYQNWLLVDTPKWDEADRVTYILRHGNRVFWESPFISWWDRFSKRGDGEGLASDEGKPLPPFFHKTCCSSCARVLELLRSLFIAAHPAQSVEVGIRMRGGTVNDIFHASIQGPGGLQVKHCLQTLELRTNYRTHAANLALSKAVRKVLARSFQIPSSNEQAIISGPLPVGLTLPNRDDLANGSLIQGANLVFLVPDETLDSCKQFFSDRGISNDILGVSEAKGLEFDAVCLLGFFSYFESRGSGAAWKNALAWLFSTKGLTTTDSSAEVVVFGQGSGFKLEPCDYLLSHPEVEEEAMLLYTALTRARNRLFLVEFEHDGRRSTKGEQTLSDFASRCFKHLDLLKIVTHIDEGRVEMTPQEHKARGVAMVHNAINFARESNNVGEIRDRFETAAKRFLPAFGDDRELHEQATKQMQAAIAKVQLLETIKKDFFDATTGTYNLAFRMDEFLKFEKQLLEFIQIVAWDTFLLEECNEILSVVEEMVQGTPLKVRLGPLLSQLTTSRSEWIERIQRNN